MGWDLVSETTSGYKKYRDSYDNLRYLDSDGNFTNASAWAGTQSHGAEEVTKDEVTGVTKPTGKIEEEIRTELDSYEEMKDWVFNEPHENDYIHPIGDTIAAGKGYPLQDYPYEKRIDKLEEIHGKEEGNYEMFTIGVHTLVHDGETITSSGYRYVAHQDNLTILSNSFRNLMEELHSLLADYGGVVVTETVIKGMNY